MKTLILLMLLAVAAHAQDKFAQVTIKKAIPVKPCEDRECVAIFWEPYTGPANRSWEMEMAPDRVEKGFTVPLFIGNYPARSFRILGHVYVLQKPYTKDPKVSAIRALTDLAKRHGAEAVTLRPRKISSGYFYAAGTAIKWVRN